MSVIGSNILAGASGQGGGYNLTRSLRFRSSASAYLNRTPASAGNRKTWTYSTWVKRGALGTEQVLISGGVISATYYYTKGLYFDSSDRLCITNYPDASGGELVSTSVYRDPSAWYHVMVAVDTTQATNTNRLKMYVNGVQVTAFSTASYPTQNTDTMFNSTSYPMFLGKFVAGFNQYFDGYKAEENFIDGQALTPSSFGETSPTTGVWQPKKYAGTYGTNGFYLPFTDNSALTSGSNAGLGKDFSGNGNYWTTNNISITSGATYDSMTDVPTLTSATQANYCVLNRLDPAISDLSVTLSNGNLTASGTTYGATVPSATFQVPSTGKWYYETTYTTLSTVAAIGIRSYSTGSTDVRYRSDGQKNVADVNSSYGSSWTTNDVIGIAIDRDAGTVTFYKNNTSQGAISIPTPTATFDLSWNYVTYASTTFNVNFGQRPFAYTPPTGFVALNTFNLPTPSIGATASTQANKYFDVSTWTGNTSTQTIVNSGGMQPDFVWIKNRSSARYHNLYNSLSGTSKRLFSNATDAEQTITPANYLSSFNSNGFSLGSDIDVNESPYAYVGWQWKANGTGVTNTDGSITSTVSANTTSGFSVVTWTGAGSTGTIGHGLGVAPNFIILKRRNSAVNWFVGGSNIASAGNGTWSSVLEGLNTTAAVNTGATAVFNSTAPTSTVFTGGSEITTSGGTFVAYCFSEVAGYSKFGSYTGNGSTDGTFVYTGFKPRYVMVKRTDLDDGSAWIILDSARDTYNVASARLLANASNAESSGTHYEDFLSNGFKLRGTSTATNASAGTYIYMAFAEFPFRYSLAR